MLQPFLACQRYLLAIKSCYDTRPGCVKKWVSWYSVWHHYQII